MCPVSNYRFFKVLKCFMKIHRLHKLRFTVVSREVNLANSAKCFWVTPIVKIYQFNDSDLFVLKILNLDIWEWISEQQYLSFRWNGYVRCIYWVRFGIKNNPNMTRPMIPTPTHTRSTFDGSSMGGGDGSSCWHLKRAKSFDTSYVNLLSTSFLRRETLTISVRADSELCLCVL